MRFPSSAGLEQSPGVRPANIDSMMKRPSSKLAVDESETARLVLRDTWRRLAPYVDRASALKAEMASDPARAADPEVATYVRWLSAFEQEIAAIQTVAEGAERLPIEDVRVARTTGEKLLAAIEEATRRVDASSSS
jgi:hypothetical protein